MKSKDLNYDAKLPAFLQRLKGELAGDTGPRPSVPRPKKQKEDDAEDDPTYVLEDTNQSLSKAEYEALLAGETVPQDSKPSDGGDEAPQPGTESNLNMSDGQQSKKPDVGAAARKRKAVKVVGNDDESDHQNRESTPVKKPKKKAKAIKLSFDD